jgi:two-component system OmpR family response regulator
LCDFRYSPKSKILPILKDTHNKKVLIVDDEVDICNLLSWILKQKNLAATYVNTLSDAQAALKKDVPSILFLDNYLPDGFGVEFIQFVKENYPATKIIMITAHDSFSEKQKALNKGADFFISKPFTKALINETIDNLLN